MSIWNRIPGAEICDSCGTDLNEVATLRARISELEAALKEAVGILEIYYEPNADGSTPTIDKCHAVLGAKQ